jgi:predicted ATPase
VRQFDADLPRSLERVVERLLEKDPARRYDDAQQLILALQSVLAQDETLPATAAELSAEARPPVMAARDAPDSLPLIGREREWDILQQALGQVRAGAGKVIVVAGEAGVGKSRLLSEVARAAEGLQVLYLRGDCMYSDAPNPYAPLAEMLQTYLAGEGIRAAAQLAPGERARLGELLARICPVLNVQWPAQREAQSAHWLQESSPQDARAQIFEALLQFFLLAAEARPLALALDDLQWASPTTLQFFHYLARSLSEAPILLLGCYRPEDVMPGPDGQAHPTREVLARLYHEHLADEIELGPLASGATALLAEHYLDMGLDQEVGERLWRQSEGNPLYLLELLSLLDDQGLLQVLADEGDLGFDVLTIPTTVRDTIMRRVERLTPDDRDLLDWAAVSGRASM